MSEATSVRGQVEERIQSYMSRMETCVSHTVGEVMHQLEKEMQVVASGAVTTSMQQMQALVGAVWGELQAQIETGHQESQRYQDEVRGEMKHCQVMLHCSLPT